MRIQTGLAFGLLLGSATAWADEPPAPAAPRFDIARFAVEGNTLLPAGQVDALLGPFTGQQRDFGDVQRALDALEQAYQAQGYGSVQVILPEQALDAAVVRLKVVETRIRKVVVEGAQHHSEGNVLRTVPDLQPGQAPNTRVIAASLRLGNENPSRQVTLQLRATEVEGEVDAVLRVTDERPWKVSVSLDNTGTRATGVTRLGLAYQHANMADRDHVLSLNYVTSPEKPDRVSIYGLGYHMPYYRHDASLDLFAGYSDVDSGVVQNLYTVSGSGVVAGLRYNQHLPRRGAYEHKLVLGMDWRAYENNARLLGGDVSLVPDVTVHPLSVSYSAQWESPEDSSSFYLAGVRNLPGGRKGGAADFEATRAGAQAHYTIFRLGGTYARRFGDDWQLRAVFNAQVSRDLLVSGEQFGLGGAGSVRGFGERELADDSGHAINLEIYSPNLSGWLGWSETQLRALAFYDSGRVRRNQPLEGEVSDQSIASFGFGVRLALQKQFSLRADVASVTDAGGAQSRGDRMLHLGLGYIY